MKTKFPSLGFIGVLIASWPGSALGALLVHEDFNYGLANGTTMHGVAVNAAGLTGSYANNTTGGGNIPFRYDTTGLTFSPDFLASSGGSAKLTLTSNQFGILGARLDAGTVTGDLYQSYLVRFTALSATGEGSGTFTRISNQHVATDTVRLALAPEAARPGGGPGAGYEGTASADMTADSPALSTGTTYLVVGRFTNVGMALSVGTPGAADLWVFSQSDYGDWFGAGALEADLSTYATFAVTDTATSGTRTFNDNSFLQFAATTFGNSGGSITVNYDEVRFGTALADVAPVPEPSTYGLLAGACAALVLRRRRRERPRN